MPRLFGPTTVGNILTSFPQIFDANQVSTDGLTTGMWRAYQTTDISNITLSGVEVVVGNVGITGSPIVTVNNPQAITGTHPVSLTGSSNTAYASVSSASISGSMSAITTGIGLAANNTRKKLYAQVIGSGGPLWLSYNGAAASAQAFNVVLKAGSSDPATDGGVLSDTDFKGSVFVSGYIGARWVLWEGV